ncbi:MAG: HlyC/CorC family transporter [Bacteroidetes bacterium]|nr:HlyC/CorC family transporter [Bacteroidota bacterium]
MENWIVILFTLLFSAFFSGMEIAFVSANLLKIELDKKKGLISGRILSRFSQNPTNFIATMLVGNNISLVIYGVFMAKILEPVLINFLPEAFQSDFLFLTIQTILSTLLILIVAEFMPKVFFRINPNYMLSVFSVPLIVSYYFLFPVVFVTIYLSEFILQKVFKVKFIYEKRVFGSVDLDNYLKEFTDEDSHVNEQNQEIKMFQNAMDFSDIKVRECMIPRTEIVAIEDNETIIDLKNKFIESGLSKVLIFNESIDNIIGYAHSFDMFKNPKTINSIQRPILFAPETQKIQELLTLLIQQQKSIAVVVDEFGGTSGMVTVEDIIEEIFGEINDEFDLDKLVEKQISENEFLFSGRTEIDYINEKYHLKIEESDDYETIGGFIIHHHESIPKKDEVIEIHDFIFTIVQVSETKIEQVILKI